MTAWGYNHWGQTTVPANLNRVIAISAGYYYSLALKEDGTAVVWGRDTEGEGRVPASLSGVVSIAAGNFHNVALKTDGTVVAWGRNRYGESAAPPMLSGVVAIAAGGFHSLALKGDGTIVGWGNNDYGQSTAPQELGAVSLIAAGGNHNLASAGDRAPFLVRQPTNQMVAVGTTFTISVGSGGTTPLHYQWWKDDAELPGQTNSTLSIPSTQFADAGGYRVVVTNLAGAATSQVARLTVGYSLTVQFSGGGSVSVSPNETIFEPGSSVTLTAIPARPDLYLSWAGDAMGSQNPLTLTMDTNKTVVATFRPGYTLQVLANGFGTVTVTPLKQQYAPGEVVQLVATPERWRAFSHWQDGVTANPRSVTVQFSATFIATFVTPVPLETLEFDGVSRLAPAGMPAVFVEGRFMVESSVSVRRSAMVSILTTFERGTLLFTLDGSDPDVSSAYYDAPFAVRKPVTLRAVAYNADFTQSAEADPVRVIILPTLNASTAGGGTVAIDPPSGVYLSDGTATVTATPEPGWTFLHWLGDATGPQPTAGIPMSRNKCVQAVFGAALGNTIVGSGSVVRNPAAALYPYGTTVRFTAVPQPGSYFALWGNSATGTNNPLMFTVTNPDETVTAVFAALPANQHALTVVASGFGAVTTSPRGNRFANGANVTLRALADPGQDFLGWSGDANGTNNPLVVAMNRSRVVTAHFTKRPRLAPLLCEGVPNAEAFQLLLTGEFGAPFSIEAAADLAPATLQWERLATLTNPFGSVQFNDPAATNLPRRFYRAWAP